MSNKLLILLCCFFLNHSLNYSSDQKPIIHENITKSNAKKRARGPKLKPGPKPKPKPAAISVPEPEDKIFDLSVKWVNEDLIAGKVCYDSHFSIILLNADGTVLEQGSFLYDYKPSINGSADRDNTRLPIVKADFDLIIQEVNSKTGIKPKKSNKDE